MTSPLHRARASLARLLALGVPWREAAAKVRREYPYHFPTPLRLAEAVWREAMEGRRIKIQQDDNQEK